MHHKLGPQQILTLLELQLELLVQDPNTYDPQSNPDTSPQRNITFNFPSISDDEIEEEPQNKTSFRNNSVDVSSPTRTILDTTQNTNTTQNITRSMYDPPSLPSTFEYQNKTIRS